MTTWAEARAAKTERQRREQRFYTPDKLGRPCPWCRLRLPQALLAAGIQVHPTCGPSEVS